MDILQKHTAQFFGTMRHGIKHSGKVIYTARRVANSDLGRRTINYSAPRKSNMALLDRVLYR